MRRLALVLVVGAVVLAGPNPPTRRTATTNEGTLVTMVRPVNGLPHGWHWAQR